MKGSANVEHAMTLAEAFSEVQLARDPFYITLAVYVQQMSNQPATQAAAQSSQVTWAAGATAGAAAPAGAGGGAQAGDDGKFIINGKLQCTFCIEKGSKFPKTNHPVADCHTLKKEIAKKKKGEGKGGKGGKDRRGGGRRGRRGGRGAHDKGNWSHANDWGGKGEYGSPPQFYGKGDWGGKGEW